MKKLKLFYRFYWVHFLTGLTAMSLVVLFSVVGCNDDETIQPNPIVNGNQFTVDNLGGVFLLPIGIEVTIPAGALVGSKEIKVDKLSLGDVNALSEFNISENTTFLSGISIATDIFDFDKPIKVKIPVENMNETSLPFCYELQNESNTWLFSDEEMMVSRQGSYIEVILKESNQSSTSKGSGMTAQIPFADVRAFFITLYEYAFFGIDPCKKSGDFSIKTLDTDYVSSEGCQVVNSSHEVVFLGCNPKQTEPYRATEINPSCEPELTIAPEGKLKVKKGESIPIKLTTLIGKHPLNKQEIKLSLTDHLYTPSPVIYTNSTGYVSFNVRGSEVGEGKITLTVLYKYYLTTIYAEADGEKEMGVAGPKEKTEDYPINIKVYDKLTVITDAVSNFTSTTAVVSGNVTDDGGEDVTDRGVYYSTSENPESTGAKVQLGSGMGGFIGNLAELEPDTTYYVKAYATNKDETAYGEQVSFKTKEEKCEVSTTLNTDYECESATVGGVVTCEGESTATERGIYLDGVKIQSGSGEGAFSIDLTDLEENTTYTVMAYVINSAGTEFGEQIAFTTPECELIDIDGNVYRTAKIGTQVWMAENLKTTTYNDGMPISYSEDEWAWFQTENPYYTWYNNEIAYKDVYGALYNWYAVGTGKLCPTGWHVPSGDDFEILGDFVGTDDDIGGKLKETGTVHWLPPNTGATDEYGFTALPGGLADPYGSFYDDYNMFSRIGLVGYWWSSLENEIYDFYAGYVWITTSSAGVGYSEGSDGIHKDSGMSCRCVKD